ncbi:MAG: hypothetical protein JNL67_00830 [Planctomycetaceae bacterium]|nr:hypothetical protein [Planctomycetaceae bacterium]
MKMFFSWLGTRCRLAGVFNSLIASLLFLGFLGAAIGQDQTAMFEVGDLIEFEFHGKKQQQVVVEVRQNGWARVEADFGDTKIGHMVLPGKGKLIRSAAAQEFAEDFRTWTDATGKFKVEATVYDLTETEVKLLKKDDKVVTIPISKLCEADKTFLSELRAKREAEVDPFAGGTAVKPRQPVGDDDMFAGGTPVEETPPALKTFPPGTLPIAGKAVKVANEIALDTAEFKYTPAEQPKHERDKSISLPQPKFAKEYEGHTNSRLFYSGNSGELIAVYRKNSFQNFSHTVLVDTKAEEIVGEYTLPFQEVNDIIVSPSKQSIVTIHNSAGSENGGIVFWKQVDGKLEPEQAWKFGAFGQQNRFTAHSSLFVDDQHLFTIGSHLALWDVASAKCLYCVSDPGAWVISRDNSHIVFFQKGSLWLMRLKDGEIVGRIQGDPKFIESLKMLEVSPDGKSLVAAAGNSLHGFDLTTGASLFSYDAGYNIASVIWADNSLLLVNNGLIVDPKLQVTVWNVAVTHGLYRAQTGSTTWIVTPDRVFGFELINDNRRNEIARNTAELKAEELLLYGPGSRISLSTDLAHLGVDSDNTAQQLREMLEKRGFVIDDSAPLRLEAVVRQGKEVEELVREGRGSLIDPLGRMDPFGPFGPIGGFGRPDPFGRGGGIHERIRYKPHSSHLVLKLNQDILWQASANYSAAGPVLTLEDGETPQDAANRLCRPNAKFFTNSTIPAKIARLPKDRPAGSTRITAAGVQ